MVYDLTAIDNRRRAEFSLCNLVLALLFIKSPFLPRL